MSKIKFSSHNKPFYEFSNFYKHDSPILIDGEYYTTIEHYFQSQKYSKDIGRNKEYRELIKKETTPYKAKILANPHKITANYPWVKKLKDTYNVFKPDLHFNANEWDTIKDNVMLKGLTAKFTQDKHCKEILLSTEEATLIEESYDKYWGNGMDDNNIGKLGELLMNVRSFLKNNQ